MCIRDRTLTTLYRGVGESILLYGAAVWAHKMSRSTYAEILLRSQRLMLLTICRGYRTVSKDALQVLTGILPIDILARQRNGRNRAKQIKGESLNISQDRWNDSEKGRALFSRFLM